MISKNSKFLVMCALLVFVASADAQSTAERANESYLAKEWQDAANAYERLSQENKNSGQYLYRLGVSLVQSFGSGTITDRTMLE